VQPKCKKKSPLFFFLFSQSTLPLVAQGKQFYTIAQKSKSSKREICLSTQGKKKNRPMEEKKSMGSPGEDKAEDNPLVLCLS
jgi:hypothetical protein